MRGWSVSDHPKRGPQDLEESPKVDGTVGCSREISKTAWLKSPMSCSLSALISTGSVTVVPEFPKQFSGIERE